MLLEDQLSSGEFIYLKNILGFLPKFWKQEYILK
jgi:hypothetical protein